MTYSHTCPDTDLMSMCVRLHVYGRGAGGLFAGRFNARLWLLRVCRCDVGGSTFFLVSSDFGIQEPYCVWKAHQISMRVGAVPEGRLFKEDGSR